MVRPHSRYQDTSVSNEVLVRAVSRHTWQHVDGARAVSSRSVIRLAPMASQSSISRRSLLAIAAGAGIGLAAAGKNIPVGLELYSVRDNLKSDLPGTLRTVAEMGYQCVEFYAPYYKWTTD